MMSSSKRKINCFSTYTHACTRVSVRSQISSSVCNLNSFSSSSSSTSMSYNKTSIEKVGLSIHDVPSFVSRGHLIKLSFLTDLLILHISWDDANNRGRPLRTTSLMFRNFISPYQIFEVTNVTLAQEFIG
jgi:hypothetical protein